MAISDVYDFYRRMEDDHIILSFKGAFTDDLLTSILHIVEDKMEDFDVAPKKKKRVFNVLVESFQNLYHHIEEMNEYTESGDRERSAIIIVKYDEEVFTIVTGNFVKSSKIMELRQKLDMVNSLSDDALRDLYRSKLENDGRTVKGTAGLGLIDIKRKSKSKLDYEIIDVTESIGFFCLSVVID